MSLSTQILDDIKTAMKARDPLTTTVLRGLKSAAKYAAIEVGGAKTELDDAAWIAVIRKEVKKRNDSIASYKKADRDDLAAKEEAELAILEKYLPAAPDAGEIEKLLCATIEELGASSRADMGKVMKAMQEKTGGAVDNKALSQLVAKALS